MGQREYLDLRIGK